MDNKRVASPFPNDRKKFYMAGGLLFACALLHYDTHFSRLNITSISGQGRAMTVEGTTDLPDGAILLMDLNWAHGKTRLQGEKEVWVLHHHFAGQVGIPPDFSTDPNLYTLQVLYSPIAQPNQIRGQVGEKGERIIGGQSYRLNRMNFLSVKYPLIQAYALFAKPA
jgi:hypothetical protein